MNDNKTELNFSQIKDRDIAITLKALKSRGFEAFYAEDRDSAKLKILDLVPQGATVGTGDSTSARQIGIIEALQERGANVFDGFRRGISLEVTQELIVASSLPQCNVFLTGTNAVTLDGRIVNVDSVGNRVAGMFYGHAISIILIGRNKIVKNLNRAFDRIRNQISPQLMKIRSFDLKLEGKRFETPCFTTGVCIDCRVKDRVCNIFTIIEGKPRWTQINVILVNEDLGLAWDESWPRERIESIIEEYKKFVWVPKPLHRKTGG